MPLNLSSYVCYLHSRVCPTRVPPIYCVCATAHRWRSKENVKELVGPLSTVWVPEIKFRSSGFVASPLHTEPSHEPSTLDSLHLRPNITDLPIHTSPFVSHPQASPFLSVTWFLSGLGTWKSFLFHPPPVPPQSLSEHIPGAYFCCATCLCSCPFLEH